MALAFRQLTVTPSAPVEDWGFEGLLAAVDRGEVADWRRIALAVRRDPWGPVARLLEREVFEAAEDSGVAGALAALLRLQREGREQQERTEVAAELCALLKKSGVSQAAFAERLGTSRTRFNTYLSGKVTPSATVVVRARRVSSEFRRDRT